MAPQSGVLQARDGLSAEQSNKTTRALLIALLVLGLVALVLTISLYAMRKIRRRPRIAQSSDLPTYEKRSIRCSDGHVLSIKTQNGLGRDSYKYSQEKESLVFDGPATPASPIPEIRITFPEEVDNAGKRQSGRVLVVRVGEHSVGLEPLHEDLPPYQQSDSDRFHSLDLDRIGGLKEKA